MYLQLLSHDHFLASVLVELTSYLEFRTNLVVSRVSDFLDFFCSKIGCEEDRPQDGWLPRSFRSICSPQYSQENHDLWELVILVVL